MKNNIKQINSQYSIQEFAQIKEAAATAGFKQVSKYQRFLVCEALKLQAKTQPNHEDLINEVKNTLYNLKENQTIISAALVKDFENLDYSHKCTVISYFREFRKKHSSCFEKIGEQRGHTGVYKCIKKVSNNQAEETK